MQQDKRKNWCQYGFDVKHKRSCRGGSCFHCKKVERVAQTRYTDSNVKKPHKRGKADCREYWNFREHGKTGLFHLEGDSGNMACRNQHEHFHASAEKASAGQRDSAASVASRSADDVIERKRNRCAENADDANRTAGEMRRVNDDSHSKEAHEDGDNGVPVDWLPKEQVSKRDHENRVAAEQNCHNGGGRINDAHLV